MEYQGGIRADSHLLKRMLPSGFEPESKPREGFMIGRYTTGAKKESST